jgi:hypothetical protein
VRCARSEPIRWAIHGASSWKRRCSSVPCPPEKPGEGKMGPIAQFPAIAYCLGIATLPHPMEVRNGVLAPRTPLPL